MPAGSVRLSRKRGIIMTAAATTSKAQAYRATAADKAEYLTGKRSDRGIAATVNTMLEVISNYVVGHPTYRKLIDNNTANPACPVQTALVNGKGKDKQAWTAALAECKGKRFTDQAAHDEWAGLTRVALLSVYAPAAKTAATSTNWKAQFEACQAALQTLQAEHAALLETYKRETGNTFKAPTAEPATF